MIRANRCLSWHGKVSALSLSNPCWRKGCRGIFNLGSLLVFMVEFVVEIRKISMLPARRRGLDLATASDEGKAYKRKVSPRLIQYFQPPQLTSNIDTLNAQPARYHEEDRTLPGLHGFRCICSRQTLHLQACGIYIFYIRLQLCRSNSLLWEAS
jgi:hypothetical protein